MLQRGSNVVPKPEPLTEDDFRAKWLIALARLCARHGDAKVAMWLGVSVRHLRNIKGGTSIPTADKIWNLLAYDGSAHDEMDEAFGVRKVATEAVCDVDDISVLMSRLLNKLIEAQHPDSPGGRKIVPNEVFPIEGMLREFIQKASTLLEQASDYREGGKLRSVA